MKRLRKVDDNIMLKMGTVDCTSPKACEAFFNVIAEAYKRREDAIDYCLKACRRLLLPRLEPVYLGNIAQPRY